MEALRAKNDAEHKTVFGKIKQLEEAQRLTDEQTRKNKEDIRELKLIVNGIPDMIEQKNELQTEKILGHIKAGNNSGWKFVAKTLIGIFSTMIAAYLLSIFVL